MVRYPAAVLIAAFLWAGSGCERQSDKALSVEQASLDAPCDVSEGCTLTAPGLTAKVLMGSDRHVLRPFPVTLEIDSDLLIEQVTLGASMKGMDMGLNRYRLLSSDGKIWTASITLPVCVSGRTDWIGWFELTGSDRRIQFQVSFSLDR